MPMELSYAEISSHLSTFINILSMTRKMKFLSWSAGTVGKAFGWAEAVSKYEHLSMEEISQLNVPELDNISYLTTSLVDIVRDPGYLILKSVLTTPLLSWSKNAVDIVRECLEQFRQMYTIDRTVYDSVALLRDSVTRRATDNLIRNALPGVKDIAKEHFSVELMCAIHSSVSYDALDGSPLFDESIMTDIVDRVSTDGAFAEIYATGLLLSPGQIMCAPCVLSNQIDHVQVIRLLSQSRMWHPLESFARRDIAGFMISFEESTLSQLINQSGTLKKIISLSL